MKTTIKAVITVGVCMLIMYVVYIVIMSIGFSNGKIDPNESFSNLDGVKDVLSDKFYFFEFDFGDQEGMGEYYEAITNTQSAKKRKNGDFEYIGYNLRWLYKGYSGHFDSTAVAGEKLDGLIDKLKYSYSEIIDEPVVIGDFDCILIHCPTRFYRLYFMIEDVRYYFEISISANHDEMRREYFLKVCETAIMNRYQNVKDNLVNEGEDYEKSNIMRF